MSITQLIYMSQPFGFDDPMLSGILAQARRNNVRDGITGALICRQDIYLQLLEGPKPAIDALYARIMPDDRHLEPVTLWRGEVAERQFGTWAMRDDPVQTWMWSAADVAKGAPRTSSPAQLRGIFTRLATEPAFA